jgi:hydrogenase-4 component F
MILSLMAVPFFAGIAAFFLKDTRVRRTLFLFAAAAHFLLMIAAWAIRPEPIFFGWIALDALGLLFLAVTSVIFLASSVYAVRYLKTEPSQRRFESDEQGFFSNAPESRYIGCALLFLSTMTLVCVSHHFGILWVGIEATTLASAPLIYFHRHHRSLEAAWKYLLICSVGIAIALLGNFFLAVASRAGTGGHVPVVLPDLLRGAAKLNISWLKAAFLCFLVGYGTKMGLAPMHSWLPDAHSESPSPVSALLSGALLNCAFLGILRIYQVEAAAGQGVFCGRLLSDFGLFSMFIAAIFIVGQKDFKRMLAYSSVEHMGILAFGIGLGGCGKYGSLLQAVNHSFAKGALFLAAGNILRWAGTKSVKDVRGVLKALPGSGVLWVAGFFAITGSPPFGLFVSELVILKAALQNGRAVEAGLYLLFLFIAFIGMATSMLSMAQGGPESTEPKARTGKEAIASILPSFALMGLVFLFGFYLPSFLETLLREASVLLGVF